MKALPPEMSPFGGYVPSNACWVACLCIDNWGDGPLLYRIPVIVGVCTSECFAAVADALFSVRSLAGSAATGHSTLKGRTAAKSLL